ncbi:MAG: sucrose-6-phosphate hydrolase [Planctomycetales bacterium]
MSQTFRWASIAPIERLSRAVERLCCTPLLALGSGGSFTVSQFACHLHQSIAHKPASAVSPLQAAFLQLPLAEMSVFVPTAGGNNTDVLGAVQRIAEREPRNMLVLCATPKSRISRLVSRYQFVNLVEYELPSGRDGFLATNSLLAFAVLLARSYAAVRGGSLALPKDVRELLGDQRELTDTDWLDRRCQPLWERTTLIVLHGTSTTTTAVDLESKFTEAALGNVQISDLRQFAHGRHHWLAKRSSETAVLALISDDDRELADQTLRLLPSHVPVHRMEIAASGWLADLAGLVRSFLIVGSAGRARGIDPGRPGVPSFGRKLYHLNAFRGSRETRAMSYCEQRAIERKSGETVQSLQASDRLSMWRDAYKEFTTAVSITRFQGLVVDYDGTLCDECQRHGPLPKDVTQYLTNFLKAGIQLGIATGRGKSVRDRLRKAFTKTLWKRIVVGYYNGAEVTTLDNDSSPDGRDVVGAQLVQIRQAIEHDRYLTASAETTYRQSQVTLIPKAAVALGAVWEHVEQLVHRTNGAHARVLRSGHSVDIVAWETSKLAVAERVRTLVIDNSEAPVLCIGDRGRWPGNDFELLGGDFGLSVYEVSPDPHHCWNVCPPGQRGRQATLFYFRNLVVTRRGLRLRLSPSERRVP